MIKSNFFIFIIFFLFSCSGQQKVVTSVEKIEKLDDMANFLMLVTDGELKKVGTCNLSLNEAMIKLNIVHQKMDEEKSALSFPLDKKTFSTCEKKCHCGLYSDLVNSQKEKDELYQKASRIEKRDLIRCAKEIKKWICKDSDFLNLKE